MDVSLQAQDEAKAFVDLREAVGGEWADAFY